MIRHAGRAAALFAVGALFAGGAWAQPLTMAQTVSDPYLVAAELLGSAEGTVVKLGSAGGTGAAARPAIRLAIPAGGVEEDNTAEITFTLTGAVFGQNVGAATLDLRDTLTDATGNPELSTEVMSGGSTGDGSVTFLVEATGDIDAGELISFWLPDLRVLPTTIGTNAAGMPVTGVSVTATAVEKRAVKGDTTGPFVPVSGAADTPAVGAMAAMNNLVNRQVIALGNVVGISMGMGANEATVALANRMVFADSNATYMAEGARTPTKALKVGTLTVSINGGGTPADGSAIVAGQIFTLDPTDPAVDYNSTAVTTDDELDNSLAGNVDVVIKGAFKTDDLLVYGTPPKAAKIADGMAAVSVPITVAGSSTDFVYVPGGVDALRPGNITAVAMRNFSLAGNAAGKPAMSVGTISYAGVSIQAYAHGVVRGGGMDSSHVRVRCANATDCTVFADCHDQDGMNYFEEAGTIDAGATSVVSSDMIAAVLGGGWSSGRGACDLLSNGSLEVQHMIRAGHTLINNSAVVGRSLSENRLKSIDDALADICSSLPGHLGREGDADGPDDNAATTADNISAVMATMCNNRLAGGAVVADTVDTNGDPEGDGTNSNGF